ncbi:type IV pilus twitching motility protein PilT [Lederbergia citrea]|uniref:type IV pilus twitching motility protein PilT n=1 Tax=Lederbergia citrea TaxID=2833581 RepID=UPI001BC8EBD5|nr:type IV pilus twitching motility protein PilT [Lederbergia citrea]MBS4176185.1 type IV pilus twitching motility protein PilT [Lederbergia citrea]MBS4202745.1 type IV pilus twitching motility protein PilT [Lederbergia citrea]
MKREAEYLLKAAFELGASDLHLTVGSPPVMRINGVLKRYGKEPLLPADTESISKALIPADLWDYAKKTGELDFSYGIPGVSRFRINAYHQRGCMSLAVRVIPTLIPTLDDLKLPYVLKKIAEKPQGLVLVTGPTGSGKSTTLAAMIDFMNRTMSKHVITLEDPIEYLHKHGLSLIDQREVGTDTHSFANGLRSALRQDPDVILVGEMRDLETIQTAITAAETGHLVLATLHTSSAPSTIDRIIDVFPVGQQSQIRIQLSSVLTAIISQRLFPSPDRKERRAALEVLINNPAIANLIRSEKVHQIPNVIQTSRSEGMQLLETSVKELLDAGLISSDLAMLYLKGVDS